MKTSPMQIAVLVLMLGTLAALMRTDHELRASIGADRDEQNYVPAISQTCAPTRYPVDGIMCWGVGGLRDAQH